MKRVGLAELRLHWGEAPGWLLVRMIALAKGIFQAIYDEYGSREILRRISDPLFFQACSNALGFDWDSSGSTTTTCYALKAALNSIDAGVKVVGGKGRHAKGVPGELDALGPAMGISDEEVERLKYASRMAAKVDNAAIQAGYVLYHHSLFVGEDGGWAIVQQGMNPATRMARRYHWISDGLTSFVREPHRGIAAQILHDRVLDMTAKSSEEARRVSCDLSKEGARRISRLLASIPSRVQAKMDGWIEGGPGQAPMEYRVPRRMDWRALEIAYEIQPRDYEELLAIRGIGPSTIRGLALIAELIYGAAPSWKDPAKFSFAFGGKDGVPFPVDRGAMDEAISFLRKAIEESRLGDGEKMSALRRLGASANQGRRRG
ncbi:MAG: DUF763 domain-containing protein [Candidatus Bathyarchaeia archaeon]